jgi:peptide/nickel transport system permease protein
MMSIPQFFILLAILAVFGGTTTAIIVVIGITSWMSIARVVRSEFIRWRNEVFIEAAVAIGIRPRRIVVHHLLPHAVPSIIVAATLGVGFAILIESAVSFLGLGIQPPTPTWGNMLMNAQQYVWTTPILAVYPGVLILLTVLAYNFLGDGLRDALDPRLRGR